MAATPTRTTATPRRRIAGGARALPRPVDAGRFSRALGAAPARRPAGRAGRFDDLLSEADVERLVCATAIRYPGSGSSARGASSPSAPTRRTSPGARRSRARQDVPRVVAEWEAGATIVLQALHVNWHPLAVFCRLLEDALGAACRRTPTTRRAARRDSASTTTRTTCSCSRSRARSAGGSTTRCSSYRSSTSATRARSGPRTADGRLRAAAGDTLYPPAWLAPRGGDVADRLAAPDDRDRGPHVARRRARALRRLEDEPGFRHDVARARRTGSRLRSPSSSTPRRSSAAAPQVRRDAQADPRGRPLPAPRRRALGPETLLERRATVIADLEEATARSPRLRGQGDRLSPRTPRRAAGVLRAEEPFRRRPARRARRRRRARPRAPPRPRGLSSASSPH
jgi:hypothetical protein